MRVVGLRVEGFSTRFVGVLVFAGVVVLGSPNAKTNALHRLSSVRFLTALENRCTHYRVKVRV